VSVLARPLEYDREEEFSVRPGLIQPEYGDHEVVWWDPSKLNLNVEGGLGLRQKEILADDGGASLAAYREWQQQRAEVLRQGVRPRFDVFLASQAVDSPPGIPAEADFESTSRAEGRPGGRRFGTLVHAVLRDVALNARRESVEVSAALNARILGAPDEERDAARAAVEACLAHPLLDRARNAERRHREYPVVLPLSDGRLLEGVIDLAFVEEGIWIVIDFKTDADSPERRVQYQRQLQWYCYALAKLTGIPAQACLLGV
jgi:ATP-dependent exoDNAse (exonuclease V) beta subunit